MSRFLARWSRLKRAAEPPSAPPVAPVDESNLPAIDTLDAGSDFSAFLQAGVSAALQARALRVAWASDPAIADFRGMAEYDWDFNAADYGRLSPRDNVAALLRRLTEPTTPRPPDGTPPDGTTVEPPAPVGEAPAVPDSAPPVPEVEPPDAPIAEAAPILSRRHGGALPA